MMDGGWSVSLSVGHCGRAKTAEIATPLYDKEQGSDIYRVPRKHKHG